jgi:hypothetical protein
MLWTPPFTLSAAISAIAVVCFFVCNKQPKAADLPAPLATTRPDLMLDKNRLPYAQRGRGESVLRTRRVTNAEGGYVRLDISQLFALADLQILDPSSLELTEGVLGILAISREKAEALNKSIRSCVSLLRDAERSDSYVIEDEGGGNYLSIQRDQDLEGTALSSLQKDFKTILGSSVGAVLGSAAINTSWLGRSQPHVVAFGGDEESLLYEEWSESDFLSGKRGGMEKVGWSYVKGYIDRLNTEYGHLADVKEVFRVLTPRAKSK